jgi:carbon-monoxide dehydrogenase iron sulfur subunit
MTKVLTVDFEKCTGCRLCELVCSVKHEGVSNPSRSRLKVEKWEWEGLYIPMLCQQCEDAPCKSVCPVKAISRDEELGRLTVDYEVCIGCRSCVAVCPFGAMSFDTVGKKVIKCDLCDGAPTCASFCDVKAIDYVDAQQVNVAKQRDAAKRISDATKSAATLFEEM